MGFSSDPALTANQLPVSLELPKLDEKDLFVEQLELLLKRVNASVNTKTGSLFQEAVETATFETYTTSQKADGSPNTRPIYRMVVDFGALPNATTKSVAHNITFDSAPTTFRATRIYGAATDPANRLFIPLPYASPTLNQNISVAVNATNVVVTTGINRTAYTNCTIVIEYAKIAP